MTARFASEVASRVLFVALVSVSTAAVAHHSAAQFDFAQTVQSKERLNLLLILTVCDIRAVGPGVWNGWKGQLLRTLHAETEA